MKLFSDDSMIVEASKRMIGHAPLARQYVLTGERYRALVEREFGGEIHVLAEPCAKNTAPCILWAALKITADIGGNAVMTVMPSDHVIKDGQAFLAALDTAVKLAAKGTRRMKITFHTRDPLHFPYDVAGEIVKSIGGDIHYTARKVAASFDYIFHFIQMKDKSQKRLKSIHEISFDPRENRIKLNPF